MGQHDPLDGFVTYADLGASARAMSATAFGPDLKEAIADFAAMIDPDALATADPLGIGGLLVDAFRVERLIQMGAPEHDTNLVEKMLHAALFGLQHYLQRFDLRSPADARLAFRELGLSIGLAAVASMAQSIRDGSARRFDFHTQLAPLVSYLPLRGVIESCWLERNNRRTKTWIEHEDINDVMLATSLAPDGFLMTSP
jgi:hypothetical protein